MPSRNKKHIFRTLYEGVKPYLGHAAVRIAESAKSLGLPHEFTEKALHQGLNYLTDGAPDITNPTFGWAPAEPNHHARPHEYGSYGRTKKGIPAGDMLSLFLPMKSDSRTHNPKRGFNSLNAWPVDAKPFSSVGNGMKSSAHSVEIVDYGDPRYELGVNKHVPSDYPRGGEKSVAKPRRKRTGTTIERERSHGSLQRRRGDREPKPKKKSADGAKREVAVVI